MERRSKFDAWRCSACGTTDETLIQTFSKCGKIHKKSRCSKCLVQAANVYQKQHGDSYRERQKRWREAHPDYYRKYRYGLSPQDYEQLIIAQDGKCAICEKERPLHIDHCHKLGTVRSLLCGQCNRGLGLFYDNPELLRKAATYLE